MSRGIPVQHTTADNVNLGVVIAFLGSWMAGVSWTDVAAFLGCLYTGWLLAEKVWRTWRKWRDGPAK